jgi:hypothetical protein
VTLSATADIIDMSAFDANLDPTAPGNQAVLYVGNQPLAPNSIAHFFDGTFTSIIGDFSGDAVADFRINLAGDLTATLDINDFNL